MKRRLFTLAIFLLLGAVVNVAVAWGCALWPPAVPSSPHGGDGVPKLAPGTSWPRPVPAEWPSPSHGGWGTGLFMSTGTFGGHIPKDQAVSEGRPQKYGLSVFRYGVPFRALERQTLMHIYEPYARTDTIIAAVRSPELISSSRSFGLIPLRPIWPGFAINTVVYAAILWLLALAPFTARRMIRSKRGHCIKCGYDLRGAEHEVCPECGVPVQKCPSSAPTKPSTPCAMSAPLNCHSQAYSEPPDALSHCVDDRHWRNMIKIPRRRRDGLMAELFGDDADVDPFGPEFSGMRVP